MPAKVIINSLLLINDCFIVRAAVRKIIIAKINFNATSPA